MSAIRKKLNSRSGISLAIALVFFLLCAMVGTVVLSAASVSAGNTARERQLYRQTLALTSAADLLSQDIQGMSFTAAYRRIETVKTTIPAQNSGELTKVETDLTYEKGTGESAPKLTGSNLFQLEALNQLTVYYYNNQDKTWSGENDLLAAAPGTAETTLTFGPVEEENIPKVTGILTVKPDYTVTVVLTAGEDSLTMTFPPESSEKTTVQGPAVLSGGAVKTTTTTYTTTLTWGQPQVRRGGTEE